MATARKSTRAMNAENEIPSLNVSKQSQNDSIGSSKPPRPNSQRERGTSKAMEVRSTPKQKSKIAVKPPGTSTPKKAKQYTSTPASNYRDSSHIFSVIFPPGSMGIEFQSSSGRGSGCVIHRMKPNNNLQLQPGDSVITIDDISVSKWTFAAIIEELRKNQHRNRVVTFERPMRGGVSTTQSSLLLSGLKGLPPTPVSASPSVDSLEHHHDLTSLPPTPVFEASVTQDDEEGHRDGKEDHVRSPYKSSSVANTTPTTVEENTPKQHSSESDRSGVKNLEATLAKTVVLSSPMETPGGGKMFCLSDGFKVHIPAHGASSDSEEDDECQSQAKHDLKTTTPHSQPKKVNVPFTPSFTSRDADGNESEISAITSRGASPIRPKRSDKKKSSKRSTSKKREVAKGDKSSPKETNISTSHVQKLTASALKQKEKAVEMGNRSMNGNGRKQQHDLYPSSKSVQVEKNRSASMAVHTTNMDDSISLSQATSPVEGDCSWSGGFGTPSEAYNMKKVVNAAEKQSSPLRAKANISSHSALLSTSPKKKSQLSSKKATSSPRLDKTAIQRAKNLSASALNLLETEETCGQATEEMSSIKFTEGSSMLKKVGESSVTWIDQTGGGAEEDLDRSMMSEVSMTPSDIAVANAHKHAHNIQYGRELSPNKTDLVFNRSPIPEQSVVASNALTPPPYGASPTHSPFSPEKDAMTSAEWADTKELVNARLLSARRHTIKGLVHGAPSPESRGLMALEHDRSMSSKMLTTIKSGPSLSNPFLDAVNGALQEAQQHTSALDVFTAARQRASRPEASQSSDGSLLSPRLELSNTAASPSSPDEESILLERQSQDEQVEDDVGDQTLMIPSPHQERHGGSGIIQSLTPMTPDRTSSAPSSRESFASPFNHGPDSEKATPVSASAWFVDHSPAKVHFPTNQAEETNHSGNNVTAVATAVRTASRVVTASASRTVFAKVLDSASSPVRRAQPVHIVCGERTFAEEQADAVSNELSLKTEALMKAQEAIQRLQAENDVRGQNLVKALDDREQLLEALVSAEESGEYKLRLLQQTSKEREHLLNQELGNARAELSKLQEELSKNKTNSNNADELEKENIELETNLLEARAECDSLRNILENERKAYGANMERVKKASQQTREALEFQTKKLEAALAESQAKYLNLEKGIQEEISRHNSTLSQSQLDMQRNIDSLEVNKKDLEEQVLKLQSESDSLKQDLEKANNEHRSALSQSQMEMQSIIETLEQEKLELEASLTEARSNADALQNMFESESNERIAAAEQQRLALQDSLAKNEALNLKCRAFEVEIMEYKDKSMEDANEITDLKSECSRLFLSCAKKDKELQEVSQKAKQAGLEYIAELEKLKLEQEAQREKEIAKREMERSVLEAASNLKQARMNSSPARSPSPRRSPLQGSLSPVPSMARPSLKTPQSNLKSASSRINFSSPESFPVKPPPLWSPEPKPQSNSPAQIEKKNLCSSAIKAGDFQAEEIAENSQGEVSTVSFSGERSNENINAAIIENEELRSQLAIVQSELNACKKELEILSLKDYDNLEEKNKELVIKIESIGAQYELLNSKLEKEVETKENFNAQCLKLDSEVECLKEEKKTLEQLIQGLEDNAVKEQDHNDAAMKAQIKILTEEKDVLKSAVDSLQLALEEKLALLAESSKQCEKLQSDIETMQAEIEESVSTKESLQVQLEDAHSKHSESATRCESLEVEVETLQAELEDMSSSIEQLEDELEEANLKIAESADFNEKLQSEIDMLNSEMDDQEHQIEALKTQCAKQEEDIEAMDRAAGVYEQIREDQQTCMLATKSLSEKLEEEVEEANALNEQLEAELEDVKETNEQLGIDLEAANELKRELKVRLDEINHLNTTLNNKVTEMEEKIGVCKQEKQLVVEQLGELEMELDNLKSSKVQLKQLLETENKLSKEIQKLQRELENSTASASAWSERARQAELKVASLTEDKEKLSQDKDMMQQKTQERESNLKKELSHLKLQLSQSRERSLSPPSMKDPVRSPEALLQAEEATMKLEHKVKELEESLKSAQGEIMTLLAKNQNLQDRCDRMATLMESNIKESAQALRDQSSKVKMLEAQLSESEEQAEAKCSEERSKAEILQEEIDENNELLAEYKERVRIAERAAEQLAATAKDTAHMACEIETEGERKQEALIVELDAFKARCLELEEKLSLSMGEDKETVASSVAFSEACSAYQDRIVSLEKQLKDLEVDSNSVIDEEASVEESVVEDDMLLVSKLNNFKQEVIAISNSESSESMSQLLAKSSSAIIDIVTQRLEQHKARKAKKEANQSTRSLPARLPSSMLGIPRKLASSMHNLDSLHAKASSYVGMLNLLNSANDESITSSIAPDCLSPPRQESGSDLVSPGFCLSPAAIDALAENSNSIVHASKSLIAELTVAMRCVRKGASLSMKVSLKHSHFRTMVVAFRRWEGVTMFVDMEPKRREGRFKSQINSEYSSSIAIRSVLKGKGIRALGQSSFSSETSSETEASTSTIRTSPKELASQKVAALTGRSRLSAAHRPTALAARQQRLAAEAAKRNFQPKAESDEYWEVSSDEETPDN